VRISGGEWAAWSLSNQALVLDFQPHFVTKAVQRRQCQFDQNPR